jgi:hypothetical protein
MTNRPTKTLATLRTEFAQARQSWQRTKTRYNMPRRTNADFSVACHDWVCQGEPQTPEQWVDAAWQAVDSLDNCYQVQAQSGALLEWEMSLRH